MSLIRDSAEKWLSVDAACDQFEADCASGNVPRVELYLASIQPEALADAIRELLKIEIHYRDKWRSPGNYHDIKGRFPDLDSKWLREQLNVAARPSTSSHQVLPGQTAQEKPVVRRDWPVVPGFEILGVLGCGGMGIVYKARQVELGRLVALKMIRAGETASKELVARFRSESRTLAQLQHPNLVQIFEVGEYQGQMFVAFEYVEGGSLDKRLGGVPQLAKPSAKLIRSLAYATQYAHARSIIHRDLKPANILLEMPNRSDAPRNGGDTPRSRVVPSSSDFVGPATDADRNQMLVESQSAAMSNREIGDFGEPKIADFGLAKHLEDDSSQTRIGTVIGSPCYMSPEQAAGDPASVGAAADIYSLGTILYEMLTGRPPFRAPSVNETLRQLQDLDPVPLRLIQPSVPRDLETICLKCLSKEPARRYESAAALADDLGRFLRDEPVVARPVLFAERAWRWCARHPLVSALTALLFLVTIGGTPTLAWKWNEANQHRLLAESTARQFRKERDSARFLKNRAEENRRRAEENEEQTRHTLYLRRIGQAYGEWQSNLVGRAARLLEECPEDLRGWEWRYLKNLCCSEQLVLREHQSEVSCVKYSDDGRTLISCTGVLGGTRPGEAIIWDVTTGQPRHVLRGHLGPINDVAMTPDGSRIATASARNVKIWNARGEETLTLADAQMPAFAIAISSDGKWVATGGFYPTIQLWNVETGSQVRVFRGHTTNVFSLAFSPDHRTLYSASVDGTVRVWNVETGEQRRPPFVGSGSIYHLTLSPDGRYLVYSEHNLIYVADLSAESAQPMKYRCACDTINCLGFSPEGRRLAVSSIDGNVLVVELKSGRELRRLHTHDGSVQAVAVGDGGRKIATAGLDGLVKIWNASTDGPADQIQLYSTANRGLFVRMAITSDGNRMLLPSTLSPQAYRSGLNDLIVINPNDRGNDLLTVETLKGHTDWLTDVATSPDGEWHASSSVDQTARIWNARTNHCDRLLEGHQGPVTCVEFSRDGQSVATGGEDGTVRLWNRASGKQLFELSGHNGRVNDVAFNDDVGILAAAGDDGGIYIWELSDGHLQNVVREHNGPVTSVVFSHDGTMLASAGRDRAVMVWDGRTISRRHILQGHAADVLDVAFSTDDRRLGSASADHTVKLWDPQFGDEAFTLRFNYPMLSLAFHPDGKRLFAAHYSSVECFSTDRINTDADEEQRRSAANLRWHYDEALDAIRARTFDAAEFHLNRAAKLDPASYAVPMLRGEAAVAADDWHSALSQFQEAESRNPRNVNAVLYCGLAGLHLGELDVYRGVCQRLADEFSINAQPWLLNEISWHCSLNPDANISTKWLLDTAQRSLAAATTATDKALATNTLAAAQFRAGKYDESRQSLETSIKLQNAVEDWILMSMVESKSNRYDIAREWLAKIDEWSARASTEQLARLGWQAREGRSLLLQEARSLLEKNPIQNPQ